MHAALLLLAALAPSAFANVYCTQPLADNTFAGGAPFPVTWRDDGVAPSLATLATLDVYLYTGSVSQQFGLQSLYMSVDATAGTAQVTIDPSVGPNGPDYFLRFRQGGSDSIETDVYSARFGMTGMTGTFSAEIAAVNGATNAALAGNATVAAVVPTVATVVGVTTPVAATTAAATTGAPGAVAALTLASTAAKSSSAVKSVASASNSTAGASTLVRSGTVVFGIALGAALMA